jgi:pantoate--beta-alanine ligase
LDAAREAMAPFAVELEYLALVDPDTLEPIDILAHDALLAIAARVGETRLIDNVILQPTVTLTSRQPFPRKVTV